MKNKTVIFQPILTDTEWAASELSSFMVYRELKNAKKDFPNKEIGAYFFDDIEDPTFVDGEEDKDISMCLSTIKKVLVKLAINDSLPMDMNGFDEMLFEPAIKKLLKSKKILS